MLLNELSVKISLGLVPPDNVPLVAVSEPLQRAVPLPRNVPPLSVMPPEYVMPPISTVPPLLAVQGTPLAPVVSTRTVPSLTLNTPTLLMLKVPCHTSVPGPFLVNVVTVGTFKDPVSVSTPL